MVTVGGMTSSTVQGAECVWDRDRPHRDQSPGFASAEVCVGLNGVRLTGGLECQARSSHFPDSQWGDHRRDWLSPQWAGLGYLARRTSPE